MINGNLIQTWFFDTYISPTFVWWRVFGSAFVPILIANYAIIIAYALSLRLRDE